MFKVGLCGKIGSGKSTVCRMFSSLGVSVYIADDRAKELMNSSHSLRDAIVAAFGAESYSNGEINRGYLSSQIFNHSSKRLLLNSIVHPAVCDDFLLWAQSQSGEYVIVESAILFESGLDKVVDSTIAVVAPQELCIERAMARDGVEYAAVAARMATQKGDKELEALATYTINNIDMAELERQVVAIDRVIRSQNGNL